MTPNEVQALFTHPERTQPSVLSVYLDVDQAEPSNRSRGFEEQLKVRIAAEYERTGELQAVKEVVQTGENDGRTVAGLARTLTAVNADRVWELIYSEGFARPGFECAGCAALFSLETAACPYCGSYVRPVRDVVERAIEHAIRKGAKLEVVTGQAASSLDSVGGIAVFLKAKTAAILA
jgi:peptide subunit release factor 1 (eRF1)